MQQILTEWRSYLAEQDKVLVEREVDMTIGLILDELNFTNAVVGNLRGAGISRGLAIEFEGLMRTAIEKVLPHIVKNEFVQYAQKTIIRFTNSILRMSDLSKIVPHVSKAAAPIAVLFSLKDIYDISVAWHKYTKVAGKTKNIRAFGALRTIEKEIKAGEFDKPKTNQQNQKLMNILAKALKANPDALEFFPTIVKQLNGPPYGPKWAKDYPAGWGDPKITNYQKAIKKTAEKYKRMAKG